MDVEFLHAIKFFLDHSRLGWKPFGRSCFEVLSKHGLAKGFRQKTWWGNPHCLSNLAKLFSDNEALYQSVLPPERKAPVYASREELVAARKKLSDYFHETYGAPEFPEDNAGSPEVFSVEFEAWQTEARRRGGPAADDVFARLPAVLTVSAVVDELRAASKKTKDEFCRDLWKRIGEPWRDTPELPLVAQYFPVPEDLRAPLGFPADEEKPAPAEPEATPEASAAAERPVTDVEPGRDDSLKALAEAFRTERTYERAAELGRRLTEAGSFGAAEAYWAQAYQLADAEHRPVAGCELSQAFFRTGISSDVEEEAQSLAKQLPDRSMDELRQLLQAARDDGRTRPGRMQVWTADDSYWGATSEERRNTLRRQAADLIQKGERLDALEFLLGAMMRRQFTDASILRLLLQVLLGLKLTNLGGKVAEILSQSEPKRSGRLDALERAFECYVSDGSSQSALTVLDQINKLGVKKAKLKAMAARIKAVAKPVPDAPAASEAEKPADAPAPAASTSVPAPAPATASASPAAPVNGAETRPNFERVPYPREYIGFIRHRAGHVNFEVKALRVKGRWMRLLAKEAEAIFPRFGSLSLHFANAKDSVSLKEDHLYCLTVDRSELRSTGDPDFPVAIDARSGQQFKPLSSAGCILVEPVDKAFDLTLDTEVTLDGVAAECPALDNESALVAVEGGYAGPFKLRVNGRGRLYLPKVTIRELSAVPLRRPAADAILAIDVPSGGRTAVCRLAASDGRAAKMTADLVRDGSLLAAAAREIPTLPAVGDVRPLLAASDVLADPRRQQRLLALLKTLGETDRFAGELRDLAVRKLLTVLKTEAAATEHPVTDAVVKAVSNVDDLKQLAQQLTRARQAVEAEHKAALAAEEKVFNERRKALRDEISKLEDDVKAAEAAGEAKKAFWNEELSRIVASAKTAISRHALSPYLENLPPAPGAEAVKAAPQTEAADFAARAAAVEALPAVKRSPSETRRHLIRAFQARRGYSHDETVNLFVSLANNFLTIFSGEPGCGKTSACGILADALGLTDLAGRLTESPAWQGAGTCDRFLAVPVERGWTSKRDFLGYFNPLTQSFSASDRRRYEAFRLLSEEAGSADAFPFVFLLDEANLSPMEYYWADFMGICGGDARASREIVLGDNVLCRIPDHLRFLATVNIDDTTEPLSPRLLDRAWIIRLPAPEFNPAAVSGAEPSAVRWKDFTAAFGFAGAVADVKEMQPFYEHMRTMGLTVSMRSRRAIAQFIAVGTPLFDGGLATAVDYAVAQKLLPMVRGSGAAFKTWLEGFRELCGKAPASAGIVDHILTRGSSNLNFFQFF